MYKDTLNFILSYFTFNVKPFMKAFNKKMVDKDFHRHTFGSRTGSDFFAKIID